MTECGLVNSASRSLFVRASPTYVSANKIAACLNVPLETQPLSEMSPAA